MARLAGKLVQSNTRRGDANFELINTVGGTQIRVILRVAAPENKLGRDTEGWVPGSEPPEQGELRDERTKTKKITGIHKG